MAIVLYDIPSEIGAWSPNGWKVRMALNFKGLTYKTEWMEFPDIELVMRSRGVKPYMKKPDGTDLYTLPVIYDASSGIYTMDSLAIAQYLDQIYPEAGSGLLIPEGLSSAVAMFEHLIMQTFVPSIIPITVPLVETILHRESAKFWRTTRELFFGCTLEDLKPKGNHLEDQWNKVKDSLTVISKIYEQNAESDSDLYIFGNVVSFADFILLGFLTSLKRGLDSNDWEKRLAVWNEGRWKSLMEETGRYRILVNQ